MTIMIGLENNETAAIRAALHNGELGDYLERYLRDFALRQNVGWQAHDKAACNALRVCAKTLRKIKAALAALPGVRRVTFKTTTGVDYIGLLWGDYVENEGYEIVSWLDTDGVIYDGVPPTTNFSLPTSAPEAQPEPPAQKTRKPKTGNWEPEAQGWRRYKDAAQVVVDKTPARSIPGVSKIIRWGVETAGLDIEEVVARLVRLGQDIGVTLRALKIDLDQTAEPAPAPAEPEQPEEVGDAGLRRSCEASVILRPIVAENPGLAPGAAILEAITEHRRWRINALQADHWTEQVRTEVGSPFTPTEGYNAAKAVLLAGGELHPISVARAIRAAR